MRKVEEPFDVKAGSKFMADEIGLDDDEKVKVLGI